MRKKEFIVVKYPNKNVMLEVVGEYATDEEKSYIYCAGWKAEEKELPKAGSFLERFEKEFGPLEFYHPPLGSDLFGRHTEEEEYMWCQNLQEAFEVGGITVFFREGDVLELM